MPSSVTDLFSLDAQVGQAAGGIERVGRWDRSRRADVDAAGAGAALVSGGIIGWQVEAQVDDPEEEPRAEVG